MINTKVVEVEPSAGELCTCGDDAVKVYVISNDEDGERRVPYCGQEKPVS